MKICVVLVSFFFTLVVAHDVSSSIQKRHADKKRQISLFSSASSSGSAIVQSATTAVTAPTSASSSSSSSSAFSTSSSIPVISSGQSIGGTSSMSNLGLAITSPSLATPLPTPLGAGTDIPPLSSITANMAPEATASITATYAAGQTPPVKGAPPLPTPFVLTGMWPTMDVVPPTDSPQVQTWLQQLSQTGIQIPDLQPTEDGSCASDPTFAADAQNRGWWTCGGYTRSTDIVTCPDKGTWGVSFDDGPSPYSEKLLIYLSNYNITATFFTVGSRVVQRPQLLVEEYMTGHEISVHTWSHHPLTTLTNEQIVAELGWTKLAIQTVLGVTPTTMRPPYGDIDDRVRAISLAMGLVPIIWTRYNGQQFDTNDWRIVEAQVTGLQSFQSFQYILGNSTLIDTGFIVLEHDLFQQTVDMAVGYTLPAALNFTPTLTLEAVGECQHWPPTELYAETTTNTSFPYRNSSSTNSSSLVVSTTVSGQVVVHTITQAPGSSSKSSASVNTMNGMTRKLLGFTILCSLLGAILIS